MGVEQGGTEEEVAVADVDWEGIEDDDMLIAPDSLLQVPPSLPLDVPMPSLPSQGVGSFLGAVGMHPAAALPRGAGEMESLLSCPRRTSNWSDSAAPRRGERTRSAPRGPPPLRTGGAQSTLATAMDERDPRGWILSDRGGQGK